MKKNSKFKVLLLAPIAPPVGGIATWTQQILDYYLLNKLNKPFVLEHYNTAIMSKKITNLNFFSRLFFGAKDFFLHYKNIIKLVEKSQPNVAHITSSGSLGLFKDYVILRYFKKKKIHTIIHFRFGRITNLSQKNNFEWKLLKKVIKLSSYVIVLDTLSLRTLKNHGFTNSTIIPNPISEEKISLYDNEREIDRLSDSILFVGHVIKNKGVFDLVRAFKNLDSKTYLTIVGPYEQEVKQELIKLAGDSKFRINFSGSLNSMEVLEKMRRCSIFVLPSYTEGFPNVILEAMSQGCTIVSTKVGAIGDILSGECGILLEPGDIDSLSSTLSKLLSDKKLSYRLGEKARAKVIDRFALDNIILNLENLLVKI